MRFNGFLLAFGFASSLYAIAPSISWAAPFEVKITSKPITKFQQRSDNNTFGNLEFVGGIEFTSSNEHVGAFSGIKLIENQSRIIAVTDTGYWFTAKIKRGPNGKPLALQNAKMAPLLNSSGKPFEYKWNADAESIAIDGDMALISFERDNRVLRYQLDLENFASRPERIKLNFDVNQLRTNKGLETIATAPKNSALQGATIIVTERSLVAKNRIKAAILNGAQKGLFTVTRQGNFDITDGDFMPNGDLILLERRFNLANGLGMRMRQIKASEIKPGATLTGKTLLTADVSYQIDNMEGLSITTDPSGRITLSLISDDNHSLLQRNLYLEFRLIEQK